MTAQRNLYRVVDRAGHEGEPTESADDVLRQAKREQGSTIEKKRPGDPWRYDRTLTEHARKVR